MTCREASRRTSSKPCREITESQTSSCFQEPGRHLILDVLVAELQLHDVLEGPEQRLVEVEVWKLRPARQHLRQDVVDEGNGLLGYVALFVTRRLEDGETFTVCLKRMSKISFAEHPDDFTSKLLND